MENRAFTKKWALFCAGKKFTDKDFVYRNQVMQNEDFRRGDHRRASVRFCSVLDTNLAGHVIREGGDFTGNGWESCSFSGAYYTGLTMEMDCYDHCMFGNVHLHQIHMLEIQAHTCNYSGSCFHNTKLTGCSFTECIFRKTCFEDVSMEKTIFRGCVFEELVMERVALADIVFENCMFRGWKPKESGCTFQDCSLL